MDRAVLGRMEWFCAASYVICLSYLSEFSFFIRTL